MHIQIDGKLYDPCCFCAFLELENIRTRKYCCYDKARTCSLYKCSKEEIYDKAQCFLDRPASEVGKIACLYYLKDYKIVD